MTNYSKLVQEEKKGVKTVFTHLLNRHGGLAQKGDIVQDWDNVKLLEGERRGLDQFLVWDNKRNSYNVLLGKKGTEFDNL